MNKLLPFLLSVVFLAAGCAGTRTFHEYAQPGDTVALAAGWQKTYSRDRLTITITPSDAGPDIVYGPDNSAIRAVVNLYPDPISSLLVSDRTGENISASATTYAQTVRSNFTSQERDWWQTVVFVDLPLSLPLGLTTVSIDDGAGNIAESTLDIVSGAGGMPNTLSAELVGQMNRQYLASLERSSFYEVTLSASTLPYAVQLDLLHDPDVDNGGIGKAYAVNPVSGVKSLSWSDDGSSMRVILTPSKAGLIQRVQDYKFYVAGGIQNMSVSSVEAFDVNGNSVAGVSANISFNSIVLDDVP